MASDTNSAVAESSGSFWDAAIVIRSEAIGARPRLQFEGSSHVEPVTPSHVFSCPALAFTNLQFVQLPFVIS